MGDALLASGRPIVFSLCEYGMGDVWQWGAKPGASDWRTTGDIRRHLEAAMAEIGFSQFDIAPYVQIGHWNDPDMLEIGNGGMSGRRIPHSHEPMVATGSRRCWRATICGR